MCACIRRVNRTMLNERELTYEIRQHGGHVLDTSCLAVLEKVKYMIKNPFHGRI